MSKLNLHNLDLDEMDDLPRTERIGRRPKEEKNVPKPVTKPRQAWKDLRRQINDAENMEPEEQ